MADIRVTYFSDVLCVWAYLNQARLDELHAEFGDRIDIELRFCSVFGDVAGKIQRSWAERGGIGGYARHVAQTVERYDHVTLHPHAWTNVAPISSLPAHLALCAVRKLEDSGEVEPGVYAQACWAVRSGFFAAALDISQLSILLEILETLGVPPERVRQELESGRPHANLASDFDLVKEYDVRMSPSLIMNEGRQRLQGNVGFRVIEANVRELMLPHQAEQASWC